MDFERRALLLAGGAVLAAATFPGDARACSLTASRRPSRFRRSACEAEIRALVRMLNEAPAMSVEAVSDWYSKHRFEIDHDLMEPDSEGLTDEVDFLRSFRLSEGKLDSKPIRLAELELVRQRGNQAAFAFTLERYSYHAADEEGCNGLFTHDEYWGEERTGYIAAFRDNRLSTLREFPEWFVA